MARHQISSQEITGVLMRCVREGPTHAAGDPSLRQWLASSHYNRCVFNDINSDAQLRLTLMATSNDSEFWTIVISYRIAMHCDIAQPHNFWQRFSLRIGRHFFHSAKTKNP